MKKLFQVLMIAVLSISVVACSQNSKKPTSGSQAVAPVHTSEAPANVEMSYAPSPADEVTTTIADKYHGIVIDVITIADGVATSIDVPFSTVTRLPNTTYDVTVLSFFPDFTMQGASVANKSMDENNPGSKVIIKNGDEVIFNGWLFQNFPDMHGFVDPAEKVTVVMKSSKLK